MQKLSDMIRGSLPDYDFEYRVHATRRILQRNIGGGSNRLIWETFRSAEYVSKPDFRTFYETIGCQSGRDRNTCVTKNTSVGGL
jgi:hypothetical protein